MLRFLSSIFNSETLRPELHDPTWRRTIGVMMLSLVVLAASELGARVLLRHVGNRWEYWHPFAAAKFDFVRDSAQAGRRLRALIVGDSTGALDLDPSAIERQLGPTVWNAAYSGNFALAFEHTTLPLVADPRLHLDFVIASFTPAGFTAADHYSSSESGIVSSPYVQRQLTGPIAGDYAYLARLKTAWPFVVSDLRGQRLPSMMQKYGFAPGRERNGDAQAASDDVGPSQASLNAKRTSVLRRLIETARARDFTLVIVIPPSRSREPYRIDAARRYREFLTDAAYGGHVQVFDYEQAPFLTADEFVDNNHLNLRGAQALSGSIGERLRANGAMTTSNVGARHAPGVISASAASRDQSPD